MNLRRYTALTRAGIIESFQYRLSMFVMIIGNLVYLTVIYFLWKAIFASSGSDTVNGMTFYSTLIYLVLATALFAFMEMYAVWDMGRCIQSGKIVLELLRPMDYKSYLFWSYTGTLAIQFLVTFLPTFIVVRLVTGDTIPLGSNLLFFVTAVILGVIINFNIDFLVGTICIYTESIWGINIMKQVIVLLLSGATIPLAFFPEGFRKVVDFLPFKAIYDTPLTILLTADACSIKTFKMLFIQLVWVIILALFSRVFWKKSIRRITVNGG